MKKRMICGILTVIVLFSHTIALCETTAAALSPSRPKAVVSVTIVKPAEPAPEQSGTASEVTTSGGALEQTQIEEPEQPAIELVVTLTEESAVVEEQMTIIKEVVEEKNVADYFGEETMVKAVQTFAESLIASNLAENVLPEITLPEINQTGNATPEGTENQSETSEETINAAAALAENLVIAEIWAMDVSISSGDLGEQIEVQSQNDSQELSDILPEKVEMLFSFETEYQDDALLLGMVGILKGNEIEWTPVPAEPVDGLVKLTFSQDILEEVISNDDVVFVLLQGNVDIETGNSEEG